MYICTNVTVKKKVKIKACSHSIYWIKIPRLNFFEFFPTFSLVAIGQRLRKLCVSYFNSRKTCPIYLFLYEYTCFEDGDIHFIAFLMWWIRECQEGQFIPCNTAVNCEMPFQKCLLFFGERKQKQKSFPCVKKLLVIAVVVFKKAKCTCFIGEKLQPKSHRNLL